MLRLLVASLKSFAIGSLRGLHKSSVLLRMIVDIKSVLIIDGVDDNCGEILNQHGISATYKLNITKNELLQEISKYDALVLCSAVLVTQDILDAGTKLKVVCRAGTGAENIDCFTASKKNIGVINAPEANALSACELTCSLLLNLSRQVVPAVASMKMGLWERSLFNGTELSGKILAIIGLGRVGKQVAIRMHAFGMKIIAFDPFVSAEQCHQFHVTKMDLDDIWPLADYITLHTPLIRSTQNLINESVLSNCKYGVKIINVGRGGLIDVESLLHGIRSGRVGGAAMDVFEKEPPSDPLSMEIILHPSVIATPHIGAQTKEARLRVGQEIAEQIVNLVKPGTFNTPIAEVTRVFKE